VSPRRTRAKALRRRTATRPERRILVVFCEGVASEPAAHGIRLAISNPCFELWLALHFDDQMAFIDTKAAERRSCQLDGRTGKRIDPELYMVRRHAAARRAVALKRRRHEQNGTRFPKDNPSSSMNEFLAAVEP
jgi:hypothetical protein